MDTDRFLFFFSLVPQLIQEPEPKPSLPRFDRNTKPIIQKPQNLEIINRPRNFHEVYGTVVCLAFIYSCQSTPVHSCSEYF